MLFLIWVETTYVPPPPTPDPTFIQPFPWFIIPLIVFAVPLVIGHVRNTYQEYRYAQQTLHYSSPPCRIWVHASITLAMFNIMLFLIWGFQDNNIPWYL